jgi:hypothetical protein
MRELAATALTTKLDPAAKLYGSSATALASSAWDADMIHSCLCATIPYFDGATKGATDCFSNFFTTLWFVLATGSKRCSMCAKQVA